MYRRESPSSSERLKDLPVAPEGTACANTRCGRTRNLWLHALTEEWLCWPHFRLAKKRIGQYKGRKQHHEFAIDARGGTDYPFALHDVHRTFARIAIESLGPRKDDVAKRKLQREWAARALTDQRRV